jgi:hypothetical protein
MPMADPVALPNRVTMPPESTHKLRMWGLLILALGVCCGPLLVELDRPAVGGPLEHVAMLSSRETWRSIHDDVENAWLIPTWNGRQRVNKPPLVVWFNLLAWSDLEPVPPGDAAALSAQTDTMILRARLVGFAMALIALAGTYWAAYSIGGVRAAAMATLATGTMLLFIRQGRTANYDTYLMGWVTLSIAAGLWAIRPLKPINWVGRRVTGWAIAGIALGAAVMTKGPIAMLYVAVPLALTCMVAPRRRLGNALGLLFTLLLAGVLSAPWYLYVMQHVPQAGDKFATEYAASRASGQPFYYYITIFILVFPWSVYLLGAMFQPFIRARGEHRRRILLGWLWFVSLLVLLSIHPTKQFRYLVPLLPAVGVMVGQLWAYHAALAAEGLKDPGVNLLRIPHWIMIIVGAIGLPAFLIFQPQFADLANQWFAEDGKIILRPDELPGIPWWVALSLGICLLTAGVLGAIAHWRWKPVSAFVATVTWIVLMMSVVQFSYARSFHGVFDYRDDAEQLAAAAGGLPVYYFYDPAQDVRANAHAGHFEPEEEFLFYYNGRILPKQLDDLQKLAAQPCYLMLRLDSMETNTGRVEGFGFTPAGLEFFDGRNVKGFDRSQVRLYRSPAVQ